MPEPEPKASRNRNIETTRRRDEWRTGWRGRDASESGGCTGGL